MSAYPIRKVRVIEVIETECVIGSGAKDDPMRPLKQYWTLKGELLAEKDIRDELKSEPI